VGLSTSHLNLISPSDLSHAIAAAAGHGEWVPPPSNGPPVMPTHGYEPHAIPDITTERQHEFQMPAGAAPQFGRMRDVHGAMPEVAQGYARRNSAMGHVARPTPGKPPRPSRAGGSRLGPGGPGQVPGNRFPQVVGSSMQQQPGGPRMQPGASSPQQQQMGGAPGSPPAMAPNPWLTSVQQQEMPQRQGRASLYGHGPQQSSSTPPWGPHGLAPIRTPGAPAPAPVDDVVSPLSAKLAAIANLANGTATTAPDGSQQLAVYGGPRANTAYDFSINSMNQAFQSPAVPPVAPPQQRTPQVSLPGSSPRSPQQQMSLVPLSPGATAQQQMLMLQQPGSPMLVPVNGVGGPLVMGPMGPVPVGMLQPGMQPGAGQPGDALQGLMQGNQQLMHLQQQVQHIQHQQQQIHQLQQQNAQHQAQQQMMEQQQQQQQQQDMLGQTANEQMFQTQSEPPAAGHFVHTGHLLHDGTHLMHHHQSYLTFM
jgi:hypothetical protein